MEIRWVGAILVLLPLLIDGGKAVTKESNIIDIWESSKDTFKYPTPTAWYDTVKTCQIKEVCPEDSENCGDDKIKWRGIADFLKNSVKVKILDNTEYHAVSVRRTLTQKDIDDLKDHICDMTLVKNQQRQDCVILWIQNQCEWEPYAEDITCSHRTINVEDEDNFPDDCSQGMNWKGTLDTFVEGDSCKLNWTSLVKQPACVQYVKLVDQKTKKMKRFMTTWSDQNFPIEYKENFDKIEIYDNWNSCFETNTKATCETDPNNSLNNNDANNSSNTTTIALVCATVVVVALIVALTISRIVTSKKQSPLLSTFFFQL